MNIHPQYNWTCLTPGNGHFAFGYYDRLALSPDNNYHLALRLPQQERLPAPGERAEVGIVDVRKRGFERLADTQAWCHQQGSMTLWLPHRPGCFLYNDFDTERRGVVARIHSLNKGAVGCYDRPIYAISRDGRWGVSLNFARIPRRGYSYACAPLPAERMPALDSDGLFLVDLHSGSSRMIASYRQLLAAHPHPWDYETDHVWLNHAIFNCDGSRVMVLLRHCADTIKLWPWKTHMMTMNLDGSELLCSLSDVYWQAGISHQMWGRTPREILIDANFCRRQPEYVVFDETQRPMQCTRLSSGIGRMGHLVFSPDGRWLAADTYPHEGVQTLAVVNVATGQVHEIGRFRHDAAGVTGDMRCDIHPRWSADGSLLTVDSIHDGNRRIYLFEMAQMR